LVNKDPTIEAGRTTIVGETQALGTAEFQPRISRIVADQMRTAEFQPRISRIDTNQRDRLGS
jgi:hypothetical protein